MADLREQTPTEDRYTRPRITQGERLRSPVVAAHRWSIVAMLALVGFLGTAGSTIYFAARRTTEIIRVYVDEQERVRAVGRLDIPEDREILAIKKDLVQVVEWIRTIPADADLLKLNWKRAMIFMNHDGAEQLKQYGRELRPDELQKSWRVRVQVKDIQPVMRQSYFVDWEERFYRLPDMQLRQVKNYRTVMSFSLDPPLYESEEAQLNWMGLKINDLTWYQQPNFTPKPMPVPVKSQKPGGLSHE